MASAASSAGEVIRLASRRDELESVARDLARDSANAIALDLESNGLFRYRPQLCTLQIARGDDITIIDSLALDVSVLAEVLGPNGPRKIVHDVAFDARMLAERGIALGNVFDTSLAARMTGKTATGLATLLGAMGIVVDKKLQHHDWTERPLREQHLAYLADDVRHLERLAATLAEDVERLGIAEAVEEETRYRLAQAQAAAGESDPRPPWARLKGIDRVPREDLAILKTLAALREEKARALDVPPYKVLGPDILFAIARAKPTTLEELSRIKGATSGSRARSIARDVLAAVARGQCESPTVEDLAWLERPRLPSSLAKARRARADRVTRWRRAEAKSRGVDEQVVLPGHCLQDLAEIDAPSLDAIARVPGIGAFRIERDGTAILAALAEPAP
jgi:ribonuclease D